MLPMSILRLALLPFGVAVSQPVPPAVATGTSFSASHLQEILDRDDYIEFAQELPHATGLKPEQESYFKGILAYRQGRFEEAVKPLIAAVNANDTSLTPNQVENGLEVLGRTAAMTYQYGASAQMYDDAEKIFGKAMGDTAKQIRERRHVGAVLQHVPPQTVRIAGDFSLKRTGKEYSIRIGGTTFSAELDTGATFSLLSESTAKSWGVAALEGTVTLHGYGSGAFEAHPAVIPVLWMGKPELHDVVVLVTADHNLYISEIGQQTHALLGYPVTSALGHLTFSRDGTLTVSAQSPASGRDNGAAMWVGDSSLLIGVNTMPVLDGGKIVGSTGARLFVLDTGSGSTYLTDHYRAEHTNVFFGPPPEMARLAGAGGVHEIPAYVAHQLPLWFGSTVVLCNGQHILRQPQGGEAEHFFGVIGQDLLRRFSSYVIDFRTMTFSVTP